MTDVNATTKPRFTLVETLNVAGSVASITGVSLLWLKGSMDAKILFFQIPIMALWASFALSATVLSYHVIFFLGNLFHEEGEKAKRACMVIVFPFIAALLYGFLVFSFYLAQISVNSLILN